MNAPALAASRHSFIRATEIWVPDPTGARLTRAEGIYEPESPFAATSAGMSFAKGEGLPGRAWAEARPVLMLDLTEPGFLRGEAARAEGLGAALAVPVFRDAALQAVIVTLFAAGEPSHGAVEIWRAQDGLMRLQGGFYGGAAAFGTASQDVTFQRGQGLPGAVWAANVPYLLQDLSRASGFLRAEAAAAAGLARGLGLPIPVPAGEPYVLTLLSSPQKPIARRVEIWKVRSRGGQAESAALADGHCDVEGAIFDSPRRLLPWQGAVGRAMASARPVAEAGPLPGPSVVPFAGVVALPHFHHGEVTRVTAWFL